ncbi:hypothetical protein PM082_003592 [Marasmius tenuissimus]|nr:hypothetical protein PM082_003592 [Marasmius tenuissimus]
MQYAHPRNNGAYRHINHGRDQNVNYGGDQNINNTQTEVNHIGRDLVKIFHATIVNPYNSIWDRIVGVGASHKAEQQFERGRCLPGTRDEVIRIIRNWISMKEQACPIFWLSGAAGVGKSAIAMTVAEACEKEETLVSSFFFFRSDPKRNNPSALWLTIAHGLASTMPVLRDVIEEKILTDSMFIEASLERQFSELILNPSPTWNWPGGLWGFVNDLTCVVPVPDVVIIDGLDECGDEETQLRILSIIQSAFQEVPHFSLRFLICSRPEAWIREAFADDGLGGLSKVVVLDETFMPERDIMKFYLHHFQEIASNKKYSQLRFPSPWPSTKDLEALVNYTCGQFVYAATVIKFIKLAFRHPILQLQIILDKAPHARRGALPYHQLDALYDLILDAGPDYDEVLPILRAIFMLPSRLESTPAIIELFLGLPMGQVTLTLRAMYSVLDIRGWGDKIRVYHNSFRDYLLDPSRSRHFHVDIDAQKYPVERQWLRNLTACQMRTYSSEQLYDYKTKEFHVGWIQHCQTCPPTRDLLEDLWNVDVASVFLVSEQHISTRKWGDLFRVLTQWLKSYRDNVRYYGADQETDGLDLVEALMQKYLTHPERFHLEWSPDVSMQKVFEVVNRAAKCHWQCELVEYRLTDAADVYLTDCRCDLSAATELHDPGHRAYQEVCMERLQAFISRFKELVPNYGNGFELRSIFLNIVLSSLLKICRLSDTELLSLCQTFFGLANASWSLWQWITVEAGEDGKKNVLEWADTFPNKFAEEREALKTQVLALPWKRGA